MKTPHSPGPWSCAPNPYGRSDAEFCVYNENGNILSNSDDTNEANARLISASPDLLSVVEDFLLCGQNAGHNQDLINSAIKAVAKAKGPSR